VCCRYMCTGSDVVEKLHPPVITNIKFALFGIIFDRVCTFPLWTFTGM